MFKKIILVFLCFFVISLAGCYDNDEIDTLATVMAVGIENADSDGEKLYTFAVSDTGGFNTKSSGDGTSLICYSQKEKDLKSAVDAVDRKISKRLSFSHVSAILYSKKTAGDGMYSDVKFFEKDYKVRPQVMIALMDLSPRKYLEGLKPELEANPEKYFRSVFQRSKTYVSAMRLSDYTNAYHCGNTVLAPVISGNIGSETINEEDAFITSSALISKGKFALEITDNPFVGLFFSDKKVKAGEVSLRSVKAPRVRVNINNQAPLVNVELYVETDNKDKIDVLEDNAERFLKSCSQKALDVINVSKLAKRSFLFLKDYNNTDWEKVLKNAEFNVEAKVISEGEV